MRVGLLPDVELSYSASSIIRIGSRSASSAAFKASAMLEAKSTASPHASLALALVDSSRAPVLLLDERSTIVGASRSFCRDFEFEPLEIAGRKLAALGQGEWNVPRLRSLLSATFAGTAALDCYEMDLVREGKPTACVVLNAHKLAYGGEDPLVLLTITDVTSARLAERLKNDLVREKEVLLLELQHRVANSLQIIASVLMQSARRVSSEETRTHLRNAHHRVLSIATLQRQLAVSSDEQVELRQYFQGLCDSIGASMIDEDGKITLSTSTDDSVATANVSTSLGLIVTELVINALKHAFPDQTEGAISVDYHAQGDGFALTVSDNGVGIAASSEPTAPGLGTGIVDALARHVGARVETTDRSPGTQVAIVKAS